MKKIILISIFCILSVAGNSQENNKFNYKIDSGSHTYKVTPLFEMPKGECKKGIPAFNDDNYLNNLFFDVIKEVLSKDILTQLHKGSSFKATFSSNGVVQYCTFYIKDKDKNVITENDLYTLYIKFKQLKIDTSKFIIMPGYAPVEEHPECADIYGPLIPKGYNKGIKN